MKNMQAFKKHYFVALHLEQEFSSSITSTS